MDDVFQSKMDECCRSVMDKTDKTLADLIGYQPSVAEICRRGMMVRKPGEDFQVFYWDGKPIARIGDVEYELNEVGHRFELVVKRNIQPFDEVM